MMNERSSARGNSNSTSALGWKSESLVVRMTSYSPFCAVMHSGVAQIKAHMDIPQRLQLLHYLIGIAKADGHVSRAELDTLKSIALYLGISRQESDSLFAMYRNTLDDAYKVLEITPDATDDEVKKAYKQMAFKHHPDRVESLGADVKKAAEEKFKAIAAAYEAIKKERGFN